MIATKKLLLQFLFLCGYSLIGLGQLGAQGLPGGTWEGRVQTFTSVKFEPFDLRVTVAPDGKAASISRKVNGLWVPYDSSWATTSPDGGSAAFAIVTAGVVTQLSLMLSVDGKVDAVFVEHHPSDSNGPSWFIAGRGTLEVGVGAQ